MSEALTPPFATKVAILVRDDLEAWQKLNVTAFLASGLAAANPDLVGEAYRDGSGQDSVPVMTRPIGPPSPTCPAIASISWAWRCTVRRMPSTRWSKVPDSIRENPPTCGINS